ncbi:hypothetical protein [Pseudoprimorskyibacter insulae]|uniref:Uncharacterized protein n=1 Tax=Pseudoprimorskyibacter insulae TaxID=1695997 RepID=A0A2R8AYB5_9RHOB|nr:hypothetical protein [Pseudoprimorskyibacter insulae]SPF80859.1 hypothetical protein PRI8871_02672 [Pseudoprimorskyibacter insulae]
MTSGLQSGNEVAILFNGDAGQARGLFDVKEMLCELRRDLALLKRPLRILRHIPGCYVEFASGALRGSVVYMDAKAPTRLFDVQMIVGRGQMTQAKRQMVQSHKSHLSVTVDVDRDDDDKRPPMSALSALKRIAQSVLGRMTHKDPAIVYWGPSVETFDRPQALAFFGSKSMITASRFADLAPAQEPRRNKPLHARPNGDGPLMDDIAKQMRERPAPIYRRDPSQLIKQAWFGSMELANSGYGKVAAGLALGILLHASLSETVRVEEAMAEPAQAQFIATE